LSRIIYLSEAETKQLLGMKEFLDYVEKAYLLYGQYQAGKISGTFSPMVSFPATVEHSDIDYRAGSIGSIPTICSTMGFGFWDNPSKFGLPSLWSIAALNSTENGMPLCLIHGYYLSVARTGASSAVSSKYLAKKNPKTLGIIGSGILAKYMLKAHLEQFNNLEEALVWSRSKERREKFASEMSMENPNLKIRAVSNPDEAVSEIDIVCTCTPSREPIVKDEWVRDGTHINAFGADAKGKQELDPSILKRSKIVVDSIDQCIVGGEINVPLSQGLLKTSDVYAQIGEIVNGWKKGRLNDSEITVMDSTGLSAVDAVCYYGAYEKALSRKIGVTLEL
jgi:alanine dehydrogenase